MQLKLISPKFINLFFLLLTAAIGIYVLYPYHNFQFHIAQGDHGNNLYAFRKTFQGGQPFQDYWWVYGPLMPYYYGLIFKFLGVSIHSVIIGYYIVNFLAGLGVYGIVSRFLAPHWGTVAAAHFWVFNSPFEHTYNHIGATALILGTLFALLVFIETRSQRALGCVLGGVFLTALIKLNIGLSLWGAVGLIMATGGLTRWQWKKEDWGRWVGGWLVTLVGVVAVYAYFLRGLPWEEARQCLLSVDNDPNRTPIIQIIKSFLFYYPDLFYRQAMSGLGWTALGATGVLLLLLLFFRKRILAEPFLNFKLVLGVLGVFYIAVLHEFLLSGVVYRIFWGEPLFIVALFTLLAFVLRHFPWFVNWGVAIAILVCVINGHHFRQTHVDKIKVFYNHPRAQVYTTNSLPWLMVAQYTAFYLEQHLDPGESFLAIPSEELYYFLLDRDPPTRQQEWGVGVTANQEKELMVNMEAKQVRYVLISNRYRTPETGFGRLGVAYAQNMVNYIMQNFQAVEYFGDFEHNGEWIENHAVMIAKRVPFFKRGTGPFIHNF